MLSFWGCAVVTMLSFVSLHVFIEHYVRTRISEDLLWILWAALVVTMWVLR